MLKGVPLSLCYYPTAASRPMSDVDILIPANHAARALRVAINAGLVPRFTPEDWPPRFSAGRSFTHPSGWEVDLHTTVMNERRGPGVDDDLWTYARPLTIGDVSTLALGPEDAVLHVIVHGAARNALSPMRWVADTAMIIRHCRNTFAWTRLLDQAEKRQMSLVVGKALRYLHERLNIPIPDPVLLRCAAAPIGLAERFEFLARSISGVSGGIAVRMADCLRARSHERDWQGLCGFLRYMRDGWHLQSTWQLPVAAYQKAIKRLKVRL